MAIAFVQAATGSGNTDATTIATSAGIATTTGNAIVVGVIGEGVDVVPDLVGVTDTALNTYVRCGDVFFKADFDKVEIWVAKNITGHAANVVTANYGADVRYRRILIAEYSGMHLTAPLDADFAPDGNLDDTSPHTSTADDTAENNELIFGFYYDYAGAPTAYSSSAPSVLRASLADAAIADNAAAAAGSWTVAVAADNTEGHMVYAKAFKQVGVIIPIARHHYQQQGVG